MTYGLKVFSGGGYTQLDSSDNGRVVYQISASGNATVTGAGTNYGSVLVNTTITSDTLILIRPTSPSGQKAFVLRGGSGFTIYSDQNVSFEWRAFRPATSAVGSSATYGLEVYNTSGSIVFAGSQVALRVKGTVTGTGTISGSNLWGLGNYNIQRVTALASPNQGRTYYWVHTFNTTSVTHETDDAFPGASAPTAEEIFDYRWVSSITPATLIIADI